ncbi:MAG: hypothetical protein ACLUOF_02340 [Ruminococcus sp.]
MTVLSAGKETPPIWACRRQGLAGQRHLQKGEDWAGDLVKFTEYAG